MNTSRLTEEEFNRIKEMRFRGETQQEIIQATGRSSQTIVLASKSKDFADYGRISSIYWSGAAGRKQIAQETNITVRPYTKRVSTERLPERYARLKEMREKLDHVLADFILEELQQVSTKLVTENDALKSEIRRLREEIEELKTPDFAKTLAERLHRESELNTNQSAE